MRQVIWCIGIVLFICSWLLLSNITGAKLDKYNQDMANRQRPVLAGELYEFLVLVVLPPEHSHQCKVQIVSYPETMQHINDRSSLAFLIPNGMKDELNRQLRIENADSINAGQGGLEICGFRVKWLSNERQNISLMSDDGIVRYSYIASANSITPVSYSMRVPKGRDSLYAMGAIIGAVVNA